jgi:hypothetical protein
MSTPRPSRWRGRRAFLSPDAGPPARSRRHRPRRAVRRSRMADRARRASSHTRGSAPERPPGRRHRDGATRGRTRASRPIESMHEITRRHRARAVAGRRAGARSEKSQRTRQDRRHRRRLSARQTTPSWRLERGEPGRRAPASHGTGDRSLTARPRCASSPPTARAPLDHLVRKLARPRSAPPPCTRSETASATRGATASSRRG